MFTPRERAERALRHAPFLGLGKEAVLPLVEQEIIEAVEQEREGCAAICDEHALAVHCAVAIRNQEDDD